MNASSQEDKTKLLSPKQKVLKYLGNTENILEQFNFREKYH